MRRKWATICVGFRATLQRCIEKRNVLTLTALEEDLSVPFSISYMVSRANPD